MRLKTLPLLALSWTSLTLAAQQIQDAPPAPQIAYQGRLLESGEPVTGSRTLSFAILDASGTELWNSGSLSVSVNQGLYGILLGGTDMPVIPSEVLSRANLSLRVTVQGQALSPDMRLVPALQARSAFEVSGTFSGDIGGTQNAITVLRLQGIPLELNTPPTVGQGLIYDGTSWRAGQVTGSQGPKGDPGSPGEQGLPGPAGPKGEPGAAGAAGPKGETGASAYRWMGTYNPGLSYQANDVVLFDGSSYVALGLVGLASTPSLSNPDWQLMAQKGSTGAQGIQGPKGDAGSQGPQGLPGLTGPKGDPGAAGAAGPKGETGASAYRWMGTYNPGLSYQANDVVLFDGSSYVALGLVGLASTPGLSNPDWQLIAQKGDAGVQGAAGAQGIQGVQGPQGIQGIQGDQGLPGATGSTGATGATGAKGDQGDPGPQGPQGAQGIQGVAGPQGPQGLQGLQGPQGVQGLSGSQGAQGASGADGLSILSGTTDPTPTIGREGEFYLNTTSYTLFGPKSASTVWASSRSLVGPAGSGVSTVSADAPLSVTNGSTTPRITLSGTLPDASFPATLPAASGANLTSLNASNLGSGTLPDARFPATLPAASGVNLTSLNASNLGSGTISAARMPALGGDLSSSSGSTSATVTRLQGVSVSATSPSSGQVLAYNGSAWAPASAASGTVSSVTAGTGLTSGGLGTTGGSITTTGTLSLADSGVTANSYTNANITVDRYGRITAAANGSSGNTTTFQTALLSTNATVTANAGTTHLLLNNQAGAPTGVTVLLPPSPTNGQVFQLVHFNASAVQAYTIDGNGAYVIASTNGATSATYSATSANTRPQLIFCQALNAWVILTLS